MQIRRAFALAFLDRYVSLVIGLLIVAATSRLLTPHEIGIAVLGATVVTFVEIIRDVPTGYLIQQPVVTRDEVRVAFTTMLVATVVAVVGLVLAANPIAAWSGEPDLASYLRILAISLLIGPFERPQMALMRREMRFGRLAAINTAGVVASAATTIGLASAGWGYTSFAWAMLASNCVVCALVLRLGTGQPVYRPLLRGWRTPVRISVYSSLWGGVGRLLDSMPYIMLGAAGQIGSVGLYARAQGIIDMPSKMMLAGVGQVAFPALAARQRAGHSLGPSLIAAAGYITALHWPAFLVLACLAHPVVLVLLGEQWLPIVPAVQIMALARLFSAFDTLVYPALMSCGALRSLLLSVLVPLPVYAGVLWLAAPHGFMAVATSAVLLTLVFGLIGVLCVRRAIPFAWAEFGRALRKSAGVGLCSAAGPIAVLALNGFRTDLSVAAALLGVASAAVGWLVGLWGLHHPLFWELSSAWHAMARGWCAVRGRRMSSAWVRERLGTLRGRVGTP